MLLTSYWGVLVCGDTSLLLHTIWRSHHSRRSVEGGSGCCGHLHAATLPLTITLEAAPARRPRSSPRGCELLASCAGAHSTGSLSHRSVSTPSPRRSGATRGLSVSRTHAYIRTRGQKEMRNLEHRMGRVGGNQLILLDRKHSVRGEFWSRTKRNE